MGGRSRRQRVRVVLDNGRVVEGYRAPGPLPAKDEFLELSLVIRVSDRQGREVVSTPMDQFIPASRIVDLEEFARGGRGQSP